MNKVKAKGIINWRVEQFTFLEFMLGILAFAFIGMGLGSMKLFLVWLGWGISIIPPLLMILRLSTDRKKNKEVKENE